MNGLPTYCMDTSALMDGLERYYPESAFPALWERFNDLIEVGRVIVSEEVWIEATKKAAATKEWCEKQNEDKIVVRTDSEIATKVKEIVGTYPKFTSDASGKNRADPFVVALAAIRNAVVITGEAGGSDKKPRIPFICDKMDVRCSGFLDIVKNEKWVF